MFTVCPKCALTLVVTAADLRVAQGYVRCGRCLNVFNALARLSEERPASAAADSTTAESQQPAEPEQLTAGTAPSGPSAPAAAPTPPSGQAVPAEPATPLPSSTLDDTGEIEVELDASILVTAARPPSAPEQSTANAAVAGESLPTEAIVVEAAAPRDSPQQSTVESPPEPPTATDDGGAGGHAAGAGGEELVSPTPEIASVSPSSGEPPSPQHAPDAQQTNTPAESPESAFEIEARRPRAGLAWQLGAAALAIALALQIVNHHRDALAANPALGRPLTAAYALLGVKLVPRWDVHAYEVRQLGASVGGAAAGEITVRASVKNSAALAQPLPLLRVTLQDRYGNRIAARDVPPDDYLPSSVARGSLLAAGSRVDATMVFVDPGPQAVGFEIDACLQQRSGAVACAHGP
jgi:predicted Zn finger-like uncharacterized protein